ncbi:2,3-butanediol dehydrogenase [Auritidibacter ignavus]|uniref:2,3-butanediol dehydrogenase n=1 Tax=Auritidibacter ignavus TaxID=678932 RepID=UPI002447196A|nr:2,3-butanediol dehydrogenase [Auritidibacter ignavus]WGH81185.1 2,3-butanediol dehydrogenase [Auritidibacter ignavus]
MKAVLYYGKEDLRNEEIDEPELVPGTVKIAPAYNGICGSDLSLYFNGPVPPAPTADEKHPLTGDTLPIVFGHEFSGVVTEVADDVEGINPGDHVAVEPVIVCGECFPCQSGQYNLCTKAGCHGISGNGGGLAEQLVVDKQWVHPVGDLPLDQAALIEPLSVALHAVKKSGVESGQTAVVGGMGPVGQLVAAVLKARGVHVIASEVSAKRKEFAKKAGYVDAVIDPTEEDLVDYVKDKTDNAGAAVAFDCAGAQVVFEQMLDSLGAGGHLEVVAVHTKAVDLDITNKLTLSEHSVGASFGYAGDHEEAIELVKSGKVNLEQFISSVIKPEDIVEKGFNQLRDHADEEVKILVEVNAQDK